MSGRKHGGCHEEARAQGIRGLFCVGELTEMEKRMYGGDPYRERVGGMHYCTKTEKAGDTLVLTVYPHLGRSDRAKAEAARQGHDRERQNR